MRQLPIPSPEIWRELSDPDGGGCYLNRLGRFLCAQQKRRCVVSVAKTSDRSLPGNNPRTHRCGDDVRGTKIRHRSSVMNISISFTNYSVFFRQLKKINLTEISNVTGGHTTNFTLSFSTGNLVS